MHTVHHDSLHFNVLLGLILKQGIHQSKAWSISRPLTVMSSTHICELSTQHLKLCSSTAICLEVGSATYLHLQELSWADLGTRFCILHFSRFGEGIISITSQICNKAYHACQCQCFYFSPRQKSHHSYIWCVYKEYLEGFLLYCNLTRDQSMWLMDDEFVISYLDHK